MHYLIPPWDHQKQAIDIAKDRDYFALFFEQGAGKTSTLINILRHKYDQAHRVLRTLVLCPPIVIENWQREFKAHSTIPSNLIIPLLGTFWNRCHTLEVGIPTDGFILITNYESLVNDKVFDKLMNLNIEVLVCDESHKLKAGTSKRTKKAIKLSAQAKHSYILSGTPIVNSPMDIFTQFLIIDKGKTFTDDYHIFRDKYFVDWNKNMPRQKYFPDWQVRKGAYEAINKEIYKSAMRVLKKDCMDLPDLVKQTIFVELSDEQQKTYRSMEKDFVAEVQDKTIMADMVITKSLRLQQIISGYVPTDDKTTIEFLETPREKALRDLLEDITIDHKVIVWAVFKQNYALIRQVCQKLGLAYTEVHGEISTAQQRKNVDVFNSDDNCRVLIGHPASAGIGISLTIASYSIFYSGNYNMSDDEQAQARNHRGGSEIHDKITRIDIIAKGTIDEVRLSALGDKYAVSSAILKITGANNELNKYKSKFTIG